MTDAMKSALFDGRRKKIYAEAAAAVFVLTAAVLSLFGCSSYDPEDFSAGSEIPDEVIDSYAAAVTADEHLSAAPETDEGGKPVVYWTQNGSVWHASASCRSLQNSQNLSKGSVEEAESAGKSRGCSVCGK